MRAVGSGRNTKSRLKWVEATTDFTVTGIESGSTTLGMDAPCLRDTAHAQFSQLKLWGNMPDLDDTALDLASVAVKEAADPQSAGNYCDDSILRAILKLGSVGCDSGVQVELISDHDVNSGFVVDQKTCQVVAKKKKDLPHARALIMSGRLNEIKHIHGHFCLIFNEKSKLFGKLFEAKLNVEVLRSLWGEKVTVEGLVNFKSNGEPQFIEARHIKKFTKKDAPFERVPESDPRNKHEAMERAIQKGKLSDWRQLIGLWPGDETAEELLEDLR